MATLLKIWPLMGRRILGNQAACLACKSGQLLTIAIATMKYCN